MKFFDKIKEKSGFWTKNFYKKSCDCLDEISKMEIDSLEKALLFREKTLEFYSLFSQVIKKVKTYKDKEGVSFLEDNHSKIVSWIEKDIQSFYLISLNNFKENFVENERSANFLLISEILNDYSDFVVRWMYINQLQAERKKDFNYSSINIQNCFFNAIRENVKTIKKSKEINLKLFQDLILKSSKDQILLNVLGKKENKDWLEDWFKFVEKNELMKEIANNKNSFSIETKNKNFRF